MTWARFASRRHAPLSARLLQEAQRPPFFESATTIRGGLHNHAWVGDSIFIPSDEQAALAQDVESDLGADWSLVERFCVRCEGSLEALTTAADTFVADFIGMTNLIDFNTDGAGASVLGASVTGLAIPAGLRSGVISVRPEDVHLTAAGNAPITGTVTFVRDLGGTIETFVEAGGKQIVAVSMPNARPDVSVGQSVGVQLTPADCVVLKS